MPIPFTCPHCGLETNVADQFAGQSGPCSGCGKTVTVPVPSGAAPFASPSAPAKSSMSVGFIVLIVVLVVGVLGVLLLCAGLPMMWILRSPRPAPKVVPVEVIPLEAPPAEVPSPIAASPEAKFRARCTNNLKRIALAMHNYHDVHKCFPPAAITDEEGTPRYSWRVAILPFLNQAALYDEWDSGAAWDSPNNSRIGQTSLPAYRCPSDSGGNPTETNYVMITGEEAVGNLPNESTGLRHITDGSSNTIMIVEVVDSGISWSEPRDLSLDDLEMRINAPGGIASKHPGGANAAFCDGSVHFLPEDITAEDLRGWITKDGGETPPNF